MCAFNSNMEIFVLKNCVKDNNTSPKAMNWWMLNTGNGCFQRETSGEGIVAF